MNTPEFRAAPEYDQIKGAHVDITLIDPPHLRAYLESHSGYKGLYYGDSDCLPVPLTGADLEYRHDALTDEVEIQAGISFNPSAIDTNTESRWETVIGEMITDTIRTANKHGRKHALDDAHVDDNEIYHLPRDQYGIYVKLDHKHMAHVQFINETTSCEVKISLERIRQLEDALNTKLIDEDTIPQENDVYELFRKFSIIWSHAIDAVATTYATNNGDEDDVRSSITICAPNPPVSSRLSDSTELVLSEESVESNTPALKPDALRFSDIAGYDDVKNRLLEIAFLHRHPDISADIDLKTNSGILLHGVPGTGKTSLIKAFANEINAELVELHASEIIEKWIGSSARNLNKFFTQLKEREELIVVCMDEFDSIGVSSQHASSGERVDTVNDLKEQITDIGANYHNIILIGATNRLDRVDEGLIRAGRLETIAMSAPNHNMRHKIWELKLTKVAFKAIALELEKPDAIPLKVDSPIDIDKLANHTDGMVGAHFDEILNSIRRKRLRTFIHTNTMPPITEEDILKEIKAINL